MKIAHFSDIHFNIDYKQKKFDDIIEALALEKPDYVCITGDLIDHIGLDITDLINFLEKLSKYKIIISLGNHDVRDYQGLSDNKWYLKLKEIKNCILLDNEFYIDNNICFYGFNPSIRYYENEAMNEKLLLNELSKIKFPKKKYNILLCHTPVHFDSKKFTSTIANFDLVLAGHTHNGLMPHFIKGTNGLITPSKKLFAKNVRNSFKNNNVIVIISGGVVKLGKDTGLFHFFDRFYQSDLNMIEVKNLSVAK